MAEPSPLKLTDEQLARRKHKYLEMFIPYSNRNLVAYNIAGAQASDLVAAYMKTFPGINVRCKAVPPEPGKYKIGQLLFDSDLPPGFFRDPKTDAESYVTRKDANSCPVGYEDVAQQHRRYVLPNGQHIAPYRGHNCWLVCEPEERAPEYDCKPKKELTKMDRHSIQIIGRWVACSICDKRMFEDEFAAHKCFNQYNVKDVNDESIDIAAVDVSAAARRAAELFTDRQSAAGKKHKPARMMLHVTDEYGNISDCIVAVVIFRKEIYRVRSIRAGGPKA